MSTSGSTVRGPGDGQVTPAVETRGVSIGYGDRIVVHDLDLAVNPSEMVALLGPSGSGKSTILAALAGFIPIQTGQVLIGGRTVAVPRRQDPPERRDVAVVFQGSALWPHMHALDTVAFPIRQRGVPIAEARREAARILDLLGIGELATRRPAEMSGGEQQRVGLGRALARNAGTYLFDEPTAHLDTALRERLQAEISEQRRRSGAAAIYATHDTGEALALADRVVLIREGRVIQVGSPTSVYECPVDQWAARLTGPAATIRLPLTQVGAGRARFELDGIRGDVRAASASPIRGGLVEAIVRPDWVRIDGDLAGTIAGIAFRGTHTDYELATSVGLVGCRVTGPPRLNRGQAIGWTLDQVWVPSEQMMPRRRASDDG